MRGVAIQFDGFVALLLAMTGQIITDVGFNRATCG